MNLLQDTSDPEHVRETARRILASDEFNFDTTKGSGIGEWIVEKLQDFARALSGLRETSPVLTWIIIAVCCILLAAILTHAIIVLRRSLRAAKKSNETAVKGEDHATATALLKAARDASARGEIMLALTLYLRAAIAGLDERGIQRLTDTATVHEYLRLLRRHPQERKLFEQLVRYYEPGVFGARALDAEPLKEVDAIARKLAETSA